ncbi:glycerol-3-phosphate 1-O-acyltransferase PlsY [Salinisphaera sp.]|uniref:glycerol-3-phosphate 1-O-acyltransferase PlsY n=1 Tax=Salinisphaera sp. TaxID=1914330 RepID=UPI002D76F3E6|nr:glycerol-3-phosphate 1-O-acyltransferase PlsY [Salinisphaera sp.]HET7313711.1 glycerol-3-phosphate 1-O-acyltransferase PlsY [Salinisphaera sp.]
MPVIAIIAAVIAAYVIGSLSGSLLLGPLFNQADLRTGGSGNAGATNALRAGGRGYGLAVLIFDMVKGAVAAGLVPILLHTYGPWPFVCGIVAILGHVYPVFYGFRGGKGAATCIGVLAVLLPGSLAFGAAVWVAVLVASGFVGLATILGMIGVAIASFFVPGVPSAGHVFVVAASLIIIYTHRGNIARMRAGNENRFERARIWRRR